MDIKSKGKSWAGNIYHQFESICQDVDGFINKDTAKFVENQVQSVSVSVKRFYSNVVQDILPVSEDTVSTKTLNHVNSVTDVTREPTHVITEKQLSVNEGSVDTMSHSCTLISDELNHGLKLSALFNADPSQVSNNGIVLNDSDHSSEEKNTSDSTALTAESSWENEIFCELFDEDQKNLTANMDSSPAVSDGTERLDTISTIECTFGSKLSMNENPNPEVEKGLSVPNSRLHSFDDPADGALLNSNESRRITAESITTAKCDGTLDDSFSAKDETTSDMSTSFQSPELIFPYFTNEEGKNVMPSTCSRDRTLDDSFSAKDETASDMLTSFQSPELVFPYFTNEEGKNVMPSTCSRDGTLDDSFSAKDETTSDTSTSFQSPELLFPYFTNEEGKNVIPSTCSTSLESSNVSESISEDFIKKAESILVSRVECGGYESKTADVHPADLISETIVGLSGSRHDQERLHEIGESKYSISSSGIGNAREFGVGDLNMETIDLSSDAKHDQDLVILNSNFTHLASHRRKNFKYYKKLIHDAFTSRKRVSKEYEHLSILYGDIDTEFSQHFRPSSAPSSPQYFFHALPEKTRDNEWELL